MSEISKNTDTVIRLLGILKRLEIQPQTLDHLAMVTRRSRRTIQRYIDILRINGFPIVVNENNEYELVSDYGIPDLVLTSKEWDILLETIDRNESSTPDMETIRIKLQTIRS